ncbi:hypothetical protein IAT38_004406 [Cryptococcus sp. DSM 104549]
MPSPRVTSIPAPSSIPRDHHGPAPPPSSSGSPTATKPRYFKNPWPSYRTASLRDAYLAYQRGAAIALHPSRTPGSRRLKLAGLEPYDENEDNEFEGEAVDEPLDPRDTNGALWVESQSMMPKKLYIRPDFSEVREQDDEDDWRDPPVQIVEPQWGEGEDGRERVTWLGHAGVLVQIPWKKDNGGRSGTCGVLFDPIFSYRCSPTQYAGPARYIDPPCSVSMLPEVHICCISHDHYDHLDYYTIMDLWKYHQATVHFFVPMGLKQWFTASGIPSHRVSELDWWRESLLTFSSFPTYDSDPHYPPHSPVLSPVDSAAAVDPDAALTLKIAFTPAQHRSGRGVFDHMTTLWGSWCVGVVEEADRGKVLERGMKGWEGFKLYFGGDTGYRYATAPEGDDNAVCPAFQQIADLYSPFSLSLLPLSTGSSLPFLRTILSLSLDQYILTSSLHCSPGDSLEIHRIIKAERTLGIHWGTFCDEDEARGTRVDFGRCRRTLGVGKKWEGEESGNGRFVVGDIGETLIIPPRGQ